MKNVDFVNVLPVVLAILGMTFGWVGALVGLLLGLVILCEYKKRKLINESKNQEVE